MMTSHKKLLKSGRADYVIAYNGSNCRQNGLSVEFIKSLGYMVVDSLTYVDYKGNVRKTIVYKKGER
jgi:hypothetical protein